MNKFRLCMSSFIIVAMIRSMMLVAVVQLLINFSNCKVVTMFDEAIKDCTTPETKAGVYDFTGMDVIAQDDTHAFLNGTWKFLKDVKSPWVYVIYTERFERGQWNVYAFNKRVSDFCKVIHSPTESWYNIYKNVDGCPLKAGVSFNLNCQHFN